MDVNILNDLCAFGSLHSPATKCGVCSTLKRYESIKKPEFLLLLIKIFTGFTYCITALEINVSVHTNRPSLLPGTFISSFY